jgi:NADH-quinone oxidoreductase subunit E
MLDTPYIRAYEVATFYTMFNLAQIGKYHIQVCGTTPCWLRGASDIMKACEKELGVKCKGTTTDGTFTLSEVECLGACVNGPMIQINDDYYEDLSPEIVLEIISKLRNGEKIIAGPQINRLNSAPSSEGVKC